MERLLVILNSGTIPTPVRVKATLAGSSISTVSSSLSIAVGLPSQLNFSLSQGTKNIEGYNIDGTPNTYQIIASDRSGSGNTANIGSITRIQDILDGNGTFKKLGEKWFDEYWINYGKIIMPDVFTKSGDPKYITNLPDFLRFKGMDEEWIQANATIRTTTGNLQIEDDEQS